MLVCCAPREPRFTTLTAVTSPPIPPPSDERVNTDKQIEQTNIEIMKIDVNIWYKKCFSWLLKNENIRYIVSSSFLFFAITYICIELPNKWQPLFNQYIVLPYLNINTGWGIALMVLCTLIVFLWCIFIGKNKTRISWRHNTSLLIIILFLYIYFRFFSNSYSFLPSEWRISFVDWGAILLLILEIEFIVVEIICHIISTKKKETSFVYDGAIVHKEQDILDFSEKAQKAATDLCKFDVSTHSWSIGITGKWGSGKTSYINLILENLPDGEYDIIRYNPRISKDVSTIQEDALNLLAEKLKVYYLGLPSLFKKYISALQLVDSSGWIDKVFSIYRNTNVTTQKNKLNDALKNLPKKVVFVIDDFDRLTKEEIMEVLKLLDNNADFPNIIYITAYDKSYVEKQLFENIGSTHCSFVDKFFNIEWSIPIRRYYHIYNYLITQIKDIVDTTQYSYDISEIYTNDIYQKIIQTHIPTMRDAKRLINLLQTDYQMVRGEVDVIDFLFVTIIKYRYIDEYTALFRREYLIEDANNTLLYVQDKIKDVRSRNIIEHLFEAKITTGRPRRIHQEESFYNYFTDHISNKLSLPQLATLFSADITTVEALLKEWSSDKKILAEVTDYISTWEQRLKSPQSIFRYIDVVLLFNGYTNNITSNSYAKKIVYEAELLKDYYGVFPKDFNKETLYEHIVKYFKKDELLPGDISLLRDMYLADGEQQNKLLILNKEEIQDIIISHFETYASNTNDFDGYCINLLYACIDHVEPSDRRIILNASCCSTARQLIEKYPTYYIEHFVRLQYISSHADSNAITCEPFWRQIFETPERLKKFIFRKKFDNIHKIKRVRNFWEIFAENNYQPIEFYDQGNVQSIIDNDMVIPMGKLKQLQKYRKELDSIRYGPFSSNEDNLNTTQYKEKLTNLKEKVENINLKIALKSQLYYEIERMLIGLPNIKSK